MTNSNDTRQTGEEAGGGIQDTSNRGIESQEVQDTVDSLSRVVSKVLVHKLLGKDLLTPWFSSDDALLWSREWVSGQVPGLVTWLGECSNDPLSREGLSGQLTSPKSDVLAKIVRYYLYESQFSLEKEQRHLNEFHLGTIPEPRSILPTTKLVGEEALKARIVELEQKLGEVERTNRTQSSRVVEERRAAATANRINDQLQRRLDEIQQRLDRQFDLINERARANDAALRALVAKAEGKLLAYEALQGEVIAVGESEIVVRFDIGDDIIEQTYDTDQFTLGKTPVAGDHLAVYVHVSVAPPPSVVPASESENKTDESPRPRRNVITGDHRF